MLAVPRGLALAWFVLQSRTVWWIYATALGLDWTFCVLSMFVLRRVKDLPKVRHDSLALAASSMQDEGRSPYLVSVRAKYVGSHAI